MALINCPECGKNISEKAKICPLCGYPIKNEKENEWSYQFVKSEVSPSGAAKFLRIISWVLWIGGAIIAIMTSFAQEGYNTRNSFQWSAFLSVLLTYIIYGGLTWCASILFEEIHWICEILFNLQLRKKEQVSTLHEKNRHGLQKINRIEKNNPTSCSNNWICKNCGEENPEGKLFCINCGSGKYS